MGLDLLDPALAAAWRRSSARRRADIRAAVAAERGLDARQVRIVTAGRRLAVSLRPVTQQLEFRF